MSPCEDYATVQKHRKYDEGFKGTNFFFCAMVFETLGAVNGEGEEVLRQLFTFAAQHLGREFSSYCSRAWARISCCLQRSVAQVIANRIDGRPDMPEPAGESFVVSDALSDLLVTEREKVSESEQEKREESEEASERVSERASESESEKASEKVSESKEENERARKGAHMSCMPLPKSVGLPPQIPPFPSKLIVDQVELKKNINRSLGGGDGDEIVMGGREGCEEGVSRENTTPILINRFGANDTRSPKEICKFGSTSSGTHVLKNVPGSAKKTGMGRLTNSHGENCNSVTYIPSSSSSIGHSIDSSSGVRNSSPAHDISGCGVRNSLDVVRNRLGSSPRSSPHDMTTVSPNTQDIIIHPAELCGHIKTSCGDVVGVSEIPQRGADSILAVKKKQQEEKKKKKKEQVQKTQKIT